MRNNVHRDFEATVIRAGLVDGDGKARYSMHDLRDSFVTDMFTNGLDPKSVQGMAGHSSVETTMKYYAAVRAKNLVAAIDRRSQAAKMA